MNRETVPTDEMLGDYDMHLISDYFFFFWTFCCLKDDP
jgi:hypothetical protein